MGNPTTLGGDFMEAVKDYDVHIDSKKRVTLRGAKYQYYNVREYENGLHYVGTSRTDHSRGNIIQDTRQHGSGNSQL